ncbi:LIM domain-containing protein [Cryptococcus neoformans c45]|nr:LIM domain-containing protein [Cryptococcus neoformans var. grubii c45]
MSLLAPSRPQDSERTSVVLPTVTCSTCAAHIALSSLGDHVCESLPVPRTPSHHSQLPMPQSSSPQSRYRPSRQGPSPVSIRPPFAGPSSAHPSPTDFAPPRRPSPHSLTPPSRSPSNYPTGFSPQLKTNSPTNPFFPNSAGSYSSSASMESMQMPDTTSGGESGMAGVGRRAFAAAAWGVRAGVALAASARQQAALQQTAASSQPSFQPTSWQNPPQIRPELHHSHTAPLQPSPTRSLIPSSPPQRSQSAMSQCSASDAQPIRKQSTSSTSSSRVGGSLSEMLTGSVKPSTKRDFFEKVKELDRSNSLMSRSTNSTTNSGDRKVVSSPIGTTFELDDDFEDQPSALPWASPEMNQMSHLHIDTKVSPAVSRVHQRNPTASSEVSTNSSTSSKSGRYGGTSGPESEEVVTPSQSFEGMADRVDETFRIDILQQIEEDENEGREVFGSSLEKNHVEKMDRESRLPLSDSASPTSRILAFAEQSIPAHKSSESFTHRRASNEKSSNYSQHSASAITSVRRKKTCQKCGTVVGGPKRFVERDGVVLCEQDWKKLYLPSCRKCKLPIEKSAVSSSDGQLKGKWHRACFACTKCDKPFEGDDFYVLGGKPWCQYHYHEENGTLCSLHSCRQPIEGVCIVLAGRNPQRYHPEHFKCDHRGGASGAQTCRESMDEYYEVDEGRYCERHVGEAVRQGGRNGAIKAEKRRTRLIDLPAT